MTLTFNKASAFFNLDVDLDVDFLTLVLAFNLDVDLDVNFLCACAFDIVFFMGPRNFRDYPVWKEAVDYATYVYKVTGQMPWFEKKGLCDQLQRAVVSISSNIAEGAARSSNADFAHFLSIALGSAFEVETQLKIAKNVGYLDEDSYKILQEKIASIERQLNALISSLRK